MKFYNYRIKKFLDKWPGKKYFGLYRFLPLFFILGASLEFSMINWRVGEITLLKKDKPRILWKSLLKKRSPKIMPAGVSWRTYLTYLTAAMLSMFAGSQVVYMYYRPLDDLEKYIEEEVKLHKKPVVNNSP